MLNDEQLSILVHKIRNVLFDKSSFNSEFYDDSHYKKQRIESDIKIKLLQEEIRKRRKRIFGGWMIQDNLKERILNLRFRRSYEDDYIEFNLSDGGGACVYECNGMYLLFELSQYSGEERYYDTYSVDEIDVLITDGMSWS